MTWLAQGAHVPAETTLEINTLAMAWSLAASLAAGVLSDRIGRRPVLIAWGAGLALPAVYLAAAGAVSFLAALLLPRTARHRLTHEFEAARLR